MNFVLRGLDSVQPHCENLSSNLQLKIVCLRIKIIIITIKTAHRTFESEIYK